MPKQRNYSAEYDRRIKRGLAKGLTRSQARGHAKASATPVRAQPTPVKPDRIEDAVRAMNRGSSLTHAAREYQVSRERLARHIKENNIGSSNGRKWTMTDARPRPVVTLSRGTVLKPTVLGFSDASLAGTYWNDVGRFLRTNDIKILAPYRGRGVSDSKGRFIPFETDPNELYRLASASLPLFYEVYERTAS